MPEKEGKIFIPYNKNGSGKFTQTAVLINQDYADIDTKFEWYSELYSFASFIYIDPESILIGNKA